MAETEARIDDADIERQRRQIGVPRYDHARPYNWTVSADAIRHFAFGIGDDNPLWHDPAYAATTRWRDQVAPPLFAISTGINEEPKPTPELKALFKGLYRGVGRYYSGVAWRFFRPLRPGDRVFKRHTTSHVEVKDRSSFAGGRTVIETFRHLYVDTDGEPICYRDESFVNAERGGSKEVSKHAGIARQTYSADDIAAIDAGYAAEERRGSEPRYWEDVAVGDRLTPVVKGPLGMIDVIAAHMAWGIGPTYGAGPLRYGWKNRTKLPAFYMPDAFGVPASMMRVHWDQERANDLGLPAPYDYGQMRSNWLAHLVTNWMGDDGWLAAFSNEIRMFNFMGDTTHCTGEVAAKRLGDGGAEVDLMLRATNQRGETTVVGKATVLLPTRDAPGVVLPQPDASLRREGVAMMTEAARRAAAG